VAAEAMVSRLIRRGIAILVLAAPALEAQVESQPPPVPPAVRRDFEISVMAGWRFESTLSFLEPTLYDRVEIDNAPTFGVTLGYGAVELGYSYANAPATSIPLDPAFPPRAFHIGIHDIQLGLLGNLASPQATWRPYLELALGATILNTDQSVGDTAYFSLGVALGVKAYLADHVGLRAEIHYVPVYLYTTGTGFTFCYEGFCWDAGARFLQQVDLRAGGTFRF
jgi:hypothetical protein